MRDSGDLSALIGSRMCHDLVSPLGAIGNGLELMQMMHTPTPEMDLVAEAVKVAQARIQLFRIAFGDARPDHQIRPEALSAALLALEGNGRITVQTTVSQPIPRPQARRLTLAALCAETALAYGGQITATETGVHAVATRLKRDPELWQPLAQTRAPETPTSATIHFAILAASGEITLDLQETELTIGV